MSRAKRMADWMKDRLDGKSLQSRIIYMECRTGQEGPGGIRPNGETRE